jgi:hypothetical protein
METGDEAEKGLRILTQEVTMSNAVTIKREALDKMIKETDEIAEKIGSFRTGEDFVNNCRGIYNDVPTIKAIGLAFKRLKNLTDEVKEGLVALDAEPKEPKEPVVQPETPNIAGQPVPEVKTEETNAN